MATGWAREGAVLEQIEASVTDAVQRARADLPRGESLSHCEECGEPIPEARRRVVAGVRRCVPCQQEAETAGRFHDPINRRGSKDSQLR